MNSFTSSQECEDTLPSQKGEGVMSGSVELHILLHQYLGIVFPGIMELGVSSLLYLYLLNVDTFLGIFILETSQCTLG